ncbi:GspH/FimT family pseudopilin [Marinobacter sp. VGCF2001]|uniref:GspH/FimT family pseudopilin n=1 Tax=Marinobacter sp. VGCF2001 TaxID=3417189 RepID=UPI003CEE6AB9
MKKPYHRGFTLIELLLVTTILTIALGIGLPSFSKLIEDSHRKSTLNQLLTGISYARTEAISRSSNVTLCPLDRSNRCSRDWNQPLTVFIDPARARQLTSPNNILRVLQAPDQGKLYGRTGIRKHFGFRPTGMARESIGHLLWCPDDGNREKAFQIRINMGGRPILAGDSSNDGIVEDAYGRNVSCP